MKFAVSIIRAAFQLMETRSYRAIERQLKVSKSTISSWDDHLKQSGYHREDLTTFSDTQIPNGMGGGVRGR